MPLDDPRRDRKAEPGAARRRIGRPPEPVEHARQVLRRGTRAAVLDAGRAPSPRRDVDVDSPPRRVPDRVVDQDPDELPQPEASPSWDGLGVDLDADVAVGGGRREPARVERDLAEVGRLELQLERPGVGPREQQQIVDQRASRIDLGLDVVERGRVAGALRSGSRRSSSTEPPMTASGVRSSWLASAANSRWRRIASRIGTSARPA